jgi:putative sterol carrier protein
MATLGSTTWLAEPHDPLAAAFVAGGRAADGPVRVQYVIGGTPDGDVRFGTEITSDGTVNEVIGDLTDPDVTLTIAYADALAIVRGEVSPNASFMRGRTKVAGHTGQLLRLLAAGSGDAYEAARAELAARTD